MATEAQAEVERLERELREERLRSEDRERHLLLAMVAILDGFVRLEKATTGEMLSEDARKVQDRFLLMRRKLENVLEREGVRRLPAIGTAFDPDLHEALEVAEGNGAAAGTVLDCDEDPFMWRSALLRRGKVVIAG